MKQYSTYITADLEMKSLDKGLPLKSPSNDETDQSPIFYVGFPRDAKEREELDKYYTPTAEQVRNWLSEVHGIDVVPQRLYGKSYGFFVFDKEGAVIATSDYKTRTYEEAMLEGINEALDKI